jgi:DNA-binding CsgD family transcriptional regulator
MGKDNDMTSQRVNKPRVFETLDVAIEQAGVHTTADHLYATSKWALEQGRRWPWFRVKEQEIIEFEGGIDNVVLAVAGMALGRMEPGTETQDMKAPIIEAGDEYRQMIYKQWYIRDGSAMDRLPTPVDFGFTLDDSAVFDVEDETTPPLPEFDPHDIKDPRLRAIWPELSQGQREVLMLVADGHTQEQAAAHLGLTSRATAGHRVAAAKKVAARALESIK